MADKKITGFDPAGTLTVNDIFPLSQNLATGELVYESLGVLRQFILGGANAGSRVYFINGAPSPLLGVDGDVAFDMTGKNIYSHEGGAWVLKDTYGSLDNSVGIIRFKSLPGTGGLSADGKTYQDDNLIDATVVDVKIEVNPLIAVENWGDTPAFDEYDFDTDAGEIHFGSPLEANSRITITASK